MQVDDLEKSRVEYIRWRILRILDVGRPQKVAIELIGIALNDIQMTCSPAELLKQIDYLEQKNLVKTDTVKRVKLASLTACGIDVVESTVPCPVGIACQE
jgi:hypothetical protein